MVSLNVHGRPRVVLFTPNPDDHNGAVKGFKDIFLTNLNKDILVEYVEARSVDESFKELTRISSLSYNHILILSHGTSNHKLVIQDDATPETDNLRDQFYDMLGDIHRWADWFRNTFDDKVVMLAACDSGTEMNTDPLLHLGLALHVIAPHPINPKIDSQDGAKAMSSFLNELDQMHLQSYEREHYESAERTIAQYYPNTIKLWPYEAKMDFVNEILKALKTQKTLL